MTETIERKGWTFAMIPGDLIMDKELDGNDKTVYSYMVWRAGKDDHAFPGIRTIAVDLGISESTVRRCLGNLIKANWVRRKRRWGSSSYTYVFGTKELCLEYDVQLAHQRADSSFTGERYISSPVNEGNQSQYNHNDSSIPLANAQALAQGPPMLAKKPEEPKKKKREPKPPDPRLKHPAMVAYFEEFGFHVVSSWRNEFIKTVQPEQERLFRQRLHEWVGRGFGPKNYQGQLDYFRTGRFPSNGRSQVAYGVGVIPPDKQDIITQSADFRKKWEAEHPFIDRPGADFRAWQKEAQTQELTYRRKLEKEAGNAIS